MIGFWDRWGNLIQRLIASVGSQASLLALVYVFVPPDKFLGWPGVIGVLAAVLALASIGLEVKSERKAHKNRKTYRKEDSAGIKAYMRNWIGESGQAVIWTRDLSWADDDQTKNLLKDKARNGNLTVCMPKMTDLGDALKKAGANVWIYGRPDFKIPASRFTIAQSGNGGSQVAIGRANGGIHVIEEIDASNPALHMATDLAKLAELLHNEGAPNV